MKANIVLAIITILFSIFFLTLSFQLPFGNAAKIGAGGWPTIILILLLGMGIILLVKSIIEMKALKSRVRGVSEKGEINENETEQHEPKVINPTKHWITSFLILLYIIAISTVGFVLATPIFIFVMALYLGMKHWIKLTATSVISSVLFVYVFAVLLSIPLPRGVGIFRDLSLLFY